MTQVIEFADTEFRDERLYSKQFSDIYFAADGPAETDRVFLEPARILDRTRLQDEFTIVEFGFGTGLNFFQTANRLRANRFSGRVRYVSFEKHPITNVVRRQALKNWWRTFDIFDEFCAASPPPIEGWHKRCFYDGKIELSLYYGSFERGISEFCSGDSHGVDAWFLDGFKPSSNPDMWNPKLLSRLREVTKANGTITSFSVSRAVRRTLEASGFDTQLIDNAPFKRHTLLASIKTSDFQSPNLPNEVRVIGGGFAGTSTARCLARKGISVQLVERNAEPGMGTSKIPMAIQHARLSVSDSADAVYRAHAYAFATSIAKPFDACLRIGAIQFADDNLSVERLEKIAAHIGPEWAKVLDPSEIEVLWSKERLGPAVWFPRSNAIRGPDLCRQLANHSRIHVQRQDVPLTTTKDDPVVIAVGSAINELGSNPPLESTNLEGQVDHFRLDSGTISSNRVAVRNGYVVHVDGEFFAGSTYEYTKWAPGEATNVNQVRIRELLSDIGITAIDVFRGQRMVNSDRFPIVGNAIGRTWYNLGHGSSGSISALFGAEIVACELSKEIAPSTQHALSVIEPWRFRERQKRRPNPFLKKN